MKIESLISELTLQAKPVKLVPYGRVCFEWCAVVLTSLVLIGLYCGLREDMQARLAEPIFVAEMVLNALLVMIAGCAATAFAYPDRAKASLLTPMLGAVFLGYSGLMLAALMQMPKATALHSVPTHGLECLVCILAFAAAPALFMVWRLRKLASVKPLYMGGAALLMAMATGCLGVRLVEVELVSDGMMLSHYLPMIVISALGYFAGQKIFRW